MIKSRPLRITFVISSLGSGGAERVVSTLAAEFSVRGYHVSIITFDIPGATPFYQLPPEVVVRHAALSSVSRSMRERLLNSLRRVLGLRAAIRDREPDVVISFGTETNIVSIMATRGMASKLIISDRVHPKLEAYGSLITASRRIAYRAADRLVIQTPETLALYPYVSKRKVTIIGNGTAFTPDRAAVRENRFVAIGRLERQKGFDILIEAFAASRAWASGWTLSIYGGGSLRQSLDELIVKTGMEDYVKLEGRSKEVEAILRRAGVFVLSSRYEGFPNVLVEAMACGAPVIATTCPSGPRTLIRDGENGVLVPPEDVTKLGRAMERLAADGDARTRLGRNAASVTNRYSFEKIANQWVGLINDE